MVSLIEFKHICLEILVLALAGELWHFLTKFCFLIYQTFVQKWFDINPHTPIAQKVVDEVVFQKEKGVKFF